MKKLFRLPVIAAAVTLGLCSISFADSEEPAAQDAEPAPKAQVDQSSANFNKTDRFLPGEEVITPTGKKMKIWSSTGPVPVSRPPEPFEDREKTVLHPGGVIIDTRGARPFVPQNGDSNRNPVRGTNNEPVENFEQQEPPAE